MPATDLSHYLKAGQVSSRSGFILMDLSSDGNCQSGKSRGKSRASPGPPGYLWHWPKSLARTFALPLHGESSRAASHCDHCMGYSIDGSCLAPGAENWLALGVEPQAGGESVGEGTRCPLAPTDAVSKFIIQWWLCYAADREQVVPAAGPVPAWPDWPGRASLAGSFWGPRHLSKSLASAGARMA